MVLASVLAHSFMRTVWLGGDLNFSCEIPLQLLWGQEPPEPRPRTDTEVDGFRARTVLCL